MRCSRCGADVDAATIPAFLRNQSMIFCSKCREESEAKSAEDDRKWEAEQKERAKAAAEHRATEKLGSIGIGTRFRGMDWADYIPQTNEAKAIKDYCQQFAAGFSKGNGSSLLFVGSPGTGKNMLAAIIVQEVMDKGFSCLHTTALKMVRKVKDSWKDKETTEQSVIDSFSKPDLLVIDEVGVQFGSSAEQMYLTEIINDRYEGRKSTILISNLNVKELTAILGERVIDRFRDRGCKALAFNWSSYRGQK